MTRSGALAPALAATFGIVLLGGCEFISGLRAAILLRRAELAAQGGDEARAFLCLEKVEALKGVPPDLLATAGFLYMRLGRTSRAVECLERAARRRPNPLLLTTFGWALHEAGRPKEAEKVLKEAYRRYPEDPEVLNSLGYFYAEQGKNLQEAVRLIRKALERKPNAFHIVDSLGWAYFKMGRLAEARRELERAVKLGGRRSAEVLYHLAVAYASLGMRESALREVRRALRLDPYYAPAQLLYLKLTAKRHEIRQGEEPVRKAYSPLL